MEVRERTVEYFVYCRARQGVGALWAELTEAHWTYMDGYADRMIARGPTLTDDGTAATGSMHIVDLPDVEAAQAFAFDEPCYRASGYGDVMIRRWRNVLGRTMWEFRGDPDRNPRYLVIGHGLPGSHARAEDLRDEHDQYFADRGYLEHLIEWGPLLSDDGAEWIGSAMLAEMPDRAALDTMLANDPFVLAHLYARLEVHRWESGGRR
jgi:uncharacterized protein